MYVEDDKIAREGFATYFKRKKYDVQVFETAAEAETALVNFKPDIIISDQKLGDNSLGWEFLKKSIPLSPNSIRFILSGYSEAQMMLNSVEDGIIFDYLSKSSSNDEIEKRIQDAFIFIEVLKSKKQTHPEPTDNSEMNQHQQDALLKTLKEQLNNKDQEIQRWKDLAEQKKE